MVRKLLVGAVCVFTLAACSSSDGDSGNGTTGGGGNGTSGTGGTNTSGTGGTSGGSAGESGNGGSGGNTGPCTDPVGSSRRDGVCACRDPKGDVCEIDGADTCVNLQRDPNHCGNCTTVCDPGAACDNGVCSAAPTEVTTVAGCGGLHLAIDATNLYWTDSGLGTVSSMPLAGGAVVSLATNQAKPATLVVDANGAYWNNLDDNTVMKAAFPGTPAAVTTLVAAQPDPILGIAVGSDLLFYPQQQNVYTVSTSGGDATFIAKSPVGVDPEEVPLPCSGADAAAPDAGPPEPCHRSPQMQCGGFPFGLFVDANRVYWTAGGRQAVESATVLGGPGCTDGYIEIAESQGGLLFQAIRAEGSDLFWVDGTTLKTADISGCEANGSCVGQNRAVTDTPNFDLISAFTVAGNSVYFIDEKGNVFKSPKALAETDGGAPEANVASAVGRDQTQFPIDPTDFSKVGSMVASDSYVYWTTSDCKIMSLPY